MDVPLADVNLLSELGDAFSFAFGMFWEILWALILGFAISAAVQAVVSKAEMRPLLPEAFGRSASVAAAFAAPGLASLAQGDRRDDQRCGWVGPPPSRNCVGDKPD
jgi:uncharacterized membrane protein YraQ (UPF0718 family)